MVKLQKLDYVILGLLGSAALASGLDMIPYCGHYLAVPVLYLCIWKVTRASLMPDAAFTVAVAYALMFGLRVFLLTALLPPIHPLPPEENPFAPQPARLAEMPEVVTAPSTNKTPAVEIRKSADDWLKEVVFKGATSDGDKSMLLLYANTNLYQLEMNKLTDVQTKGGTCQMRLVNVSESWGTIEVNGETAYLRLR
ncbi:MAG TPA: hypothetical protein VL970_15385 [Candidatus Acidoferrales bacterium]|nr:hypothetical protein [Candidatus Acidoferrales bacterium]